jgi:hypothetical protein
MGLPLAVSVPLRLLLLAFMLWVSTAISRVVCCTTFSISAVGFAADPLRTAFMQCFRADGEPGFITWQGV